MERRGECDLIVSGGEGGWGTCGRGEARGEKEWEGGEGGERLGGGMVDCEGSCGGESAGDR